jgi:hypothetical protein
LLKLRIHIVISFVVSQLQLLAAAGVITDIVGAIILSRALVFSRPADLLRQQQPRYCGNPDLLKALSEQGYDARYGGSLLLAGFVLQLLGNLGIQVSLGVFWFILLALMAAIAAYLAIRTRSVRSLYMAAVDYEVDESDREALKGLYPE